MRITYVVAVHNSADHLETTVAKVVARLRAHPGSEVLLVENGSSDDSPEIAQRLAASQSSPQPSGDSSGSSAPGSSNSVSVAYTTSATGLGFAFRRGLELAVGDVVVLTASDLPFGFTDLDAYLGLDDPRPALVMGSKGHRDSVTDVSALRRVLSAGFRLLRLATLGIRYADTQGTLILERNLITRIAPLLACDDYLITTEIVAWAERSGARCVEVPVTYPRAESSTVSPLRDSVRMAAGLLRLSRRLDDHAVAAIDSVVDPRLVTRVHATAPLKRAVVAGGAVVIATCVLLGTVILPLLAVALAGRLLTHVGLSAHPQVAAALTWSACVLGAALVMLRVRHGSRS